MKTKYKYIKFVKLQTKEHVRRDIYGCITNRKPESMLGKVEYYYPWKQYIFEPSDLAVFSSDCLDDISSFINQLN